jgi:hypothetical protein
MVAALLLLAAVHGQAQITVTSSSAQVAPGQEAVITYSIAGTMPGDDVATYTGEISFDVTNVGMSSACAGGPNDGTMCTQASECPDGLCLANCTQAPALTEQVTQVSRPLPNQLILFVGDTSFPVASVGDGNLFQCTFNVPDTAAEGSYELTSSFLEVADTDGVPLEATIDDGSIVVTRACACDCSGDGRTTGSEITRCVLILGQALPLSNCPPADSNKDMRVTGGDITRGVLALGAGLACTRF